MHKRKQFIKKKYSVARKLYIKTNTEGQSMLLLMAVTRRK